MNIYHMNTDVVEKIGFKKEISNVEIYGIEAIINELHEEETLEVNADELGLAYTSNTDYGTLNACNGIGDHEQFNINSFAILSDGRLIMICFDTADTAQYFIIE